MVKNFDVRIIAPKEVLIFSTSYINPLEYRDEIEQWLKDHNKVEVIFDLLLTNGNASNRYIKAVFDGKRLTGFRKCVKLEDAVKSMSKKFYMNNKDLLQNSILTGPQKFLVEKGLM